MTVRYNISGRINGVNDFGLTQATLKYSARLAATTAVTLTVPGVDSQGNFNRPNKFIAVFRYQAARDVFVSVNGTAAVPAAPTGSALNAATSEMNPPAYEVKAGDVISFITRDANTDLTVTLYPI